MNRHHDDNEDNVRQKPIEDEGTRTGDSKIDHLYEEECKILVPSNVVTRYQKADWEDWIRSINRIASSTSTSSYQKSPSKQPNASAPEQSSSPSASLPLNSYNTFSHRLLTHPNGRRDRIKRRSNYFSNNNKRRRGRGNQRTGYYDYYDSYYKVQTVLIIRTNRGVVEMPIEAHSKRENVYGLPDIIYFDNDDDDKNKNAITQEEVQKQHISSDEASTSSNQSHKYTKNTSSIDRSNNKNKKKKKISTAAGNRRPVRSRKRMVPLATPSIVRSVTATNEEQERIIEETLRLFRNENQKTRKMKKKKNNYEEEGFDKGVGTVRNKDKVPNTPSSRNHRKQQNTDPTSSNTNNAIIWIVDSRSTSSIVFSHRDATVSTSDMNNEYDDVSVIYDRTRNSSSNNGNNSWKDTITVNDDHHHHPSSEPTTEPLPFSSCYHVYIKHPAVRSKGSSSSTTTADTGTTNGMGANTYETTESASYSDDNSMYASGGSFFVMEALVTLPQYVSIQVESDRIPLFQEVTSRQVINRWILLNSNNQTSTNYSDDKKSYNGNNEGHDDRSDHRSSKDEDYGVTDSSLLIPADGKQHYVVTVCARSNGTTVLNTKDQHSVEEDNEGDNTTTSSYLQDIKDLLEASGHRNATKSLGFLQLRTNLETFFIALERDEGEDGEKDVIVLNTSTMTPTMKPIDVSNGNYNNDENRQDQPDVKMTNPRMQYQDSASPTVLSSSGQNTRTTVPVLRATPSNINFHYLYSGKNTVSSSIDLENISKEYSVKITRASIAIQSPPKFRKLLTTTSENKTPRQQLELLGVTVKLEELHQSLALPLFPNNNTSNSSGSGGSGNKVASAVQITCTVDWDTLMQPSNVVFASRLQVLLQSSSSSSSLIRFQGAVVIRGTLIPPSLNTNNNGRRILFDDDDHDDDLYGSDGTNGYVVLDIPLTITLRKGTIGYTIESTSLLTSPFYPPSKYEEGMFTTFEWDQGAYFPLSQSTYLSSFGKDVPNSSKNSDVITIEDRLHIHGNDIGYFDNVQFSHVEIVDQSADVIVGSGHPIATSNTSLCNRFSVEYSQYNTMSYPVDGYPLYDIGVISLKYVIPVESKSNSNIYYNSNKRNNHNNNFYVTNNDSDVHPVPCYLRIQTIPDTGIHEMPLVIYSGNIEVSNSLFLGSSPFHIHPNNAQAMFNSGGRINANNNSGIEDSDDNGIGRVPEARRHVVGFDPVLRWFLHSRLGSSLRALLSSSPDSKSIKNKPELLLIKYLQSLIATTVAERLAAENNNNDSGLRNSDQQIRNKLAATLAEVPIRPIVVKAGSVSQGDYEIIPLYITNSNPLPMSVTIEIGGVEGMNIAIGRDKVNETPQGGNAFKIGNDNNNVERNNGANTDSLRRVTSIFLDQRFRNGGYEQVSQPESEFVPEAIVQDSLFRGHPIDGLRDFLLNDDMAIKFFNRFPYKDAVSMSVDLTSKLPLLKPLYVHYNRVRFHKTRVPERLTSKFGHNHCYNSHHHQGSHSHKNSFVHPPTYGSFEDIQSIVRREPILGPLILSSDSSKIRRLQSCSDYTKASKQDSDTIFLPPAGIVRFDIAIRSPPSAVLDNDITHFLASGLVLSTSFGEILPVLVSFEGLQGNLEVSHIPSLYEPLPNNNNLRTEIGQSSNVIEVPACIFGKNSRNGLLPMHGEPASIKIRPRSIRAPTFAQLARGEMIFSRNASSDINGVALYMKSSFSRDVMLQYVVSCNPWFQVTLADHSATNDVDPFLGVNIGMIRNNVPCDPVNGVPEPSTPFPSFFRCALQWLAMKSELQPVGCGRSVVVTKDAPTATAISVEKTMKSLQHALLVSEWSDKIYSSIHDAKAKSKAFVQKDGSKNSMKSGRRSKDGVASPLLMETIANALASLRSASAHGLLTIGTGLRVVLEYNATADEKATKNRQSGSGGDGTYQDDEQSQLLSSALRNVTFETNLEIPKLFRAPAVHNNNLGHSMFDTPVVTFEPTLVGAVSSVRIPLRNPTSVFVRVRLAVAPSDISVDLERFAGPYQPPYVQTHRRQKTTSSSQPENVIHQQWWERRGAFHHPDYHGNILRSECNTTFRSGLGARVGFVNPSYFGTSAFVVGCGVRCGLRSDRTSGNFASSSPIGSSAAIGKYLIGHERNAYGIPDTVTKGKGNWFLAAGGSIFNNGIGPTPFAIPVSALDEVIIPPFGVVELGPILFRPPGRTTKMGVQGTAKDARNDEVLQEYEGTIFIENSISGLERVILKGRAQWQKIVFLDSFDDEFGDIEFRYGYSTLVFPGTNEENSRTVIKKVLVQNDGDTVVNIKSGYLTPLTKLDPDRTKREETFVHSCELKGFYLRGCNLQKYSSVFPFVLLPGQNKSLFIEHRPLCTKKRDYITLVLTLDQDKPSYKGHSVKETRSNTRMRRKKIENPFHRPTVELLVGFDMLDSTHAACIPFTRPKEIISNGKSRSRWLDQRAATEYVGSYFSVIFILMTLLLVLSHFLQNGLNKSHEFHRQYRRRKQTSSTYMSTAHRKDAWSTTFCRLAESDPTPVNLRAIAQEQNRRLVYETYKTAGVMSPQCFDGVGTLQRDRSIVSGRQFGGNSERSRNLSDSMFGQCTVVNGTGHGIIPLNLCWRTAAQNGIITVTSLERASANSRSKALLKEKHGKPISSESDESIDVSEVDDESKSFHDSDLDSSFDRSIEEDQADKHSLEFVKFVSDSTSTYQLEHGENKYLNQDKDSHEQKDSQQDFSSDRQTESVDSSIGLNNEADTTKQKGKDIEPVNDKKTEIKATTEESKQLHKTERLARPNFVVISKPAVATTVQKPTVASTLKTEKRQASKALLGPHTQDVADQNEGRISEKSFKASPDSTKHNITSKSAGNRASSRNKLSGDETRARRARSRVDEPKNTGTSSEYDSGKQLVEQTSTFSPSKSNRRRENVPKDANNKIQPSKAKSDRDSTVDNRKKQTSIGKTDSGKKHKMKSENKNRKLSEPVTISDSNEPNQGGLDDVTTPPLPSPAWRPPPGLVPPPGFGDVSITPSVTPTADVLSSSNGDILLTPSHFQTDLTSFCEENPIASISSGNMTSQALLTLPDPTSIQVSQTIELTSSEGNTMNPSDFVYRWGGPFESGSTSMGENSQNSSTAGFDVMDFLDGILNDGGSVTDEDAGRNNVIPDSIILDPSLVRSQEDDDVVLPNISSNPWAMENVLLDNISSRAAAYGISFEDPQDRVSYDANSLDLPLLIESTVFPPDKDDDNDVVKRNMVEDD